MKPFRLATLGAAAVVSTALALPLVATPFVATPAAAAEKMAMSTDVKSAQSALNKSGAKLHVDGKMGPSTVAALKAYQKSHNLTVTGMLDAKTKTALGVM